MLESTGGTRLKSAGEGLFKALGQKAVSAAGDHLTGLTDKLEDVASGNPKAQMALSTGQSVANGESPVKGALKGMGSAIKDKIPGLGGGSSKKGAPKATKATNIIETIDVGVPIKVAYNQWTEFEDFPGFMKKVENAKPKDDHVKMDWKAQIFWSHREWEATILEMVPEDRIVWRSRGRKGHVDGAVTFHELAPNMTRIIVVLEYYPQGLFEKTGNIWRAQGRRARAETKHFQRHVMTRTILDPDGVEGWRGTIQDSEVVKSHEDAVAEQEEQDQQDQQDQEQQDGGEGAEDSSDEQSQDDTGQDDVTDEDSSDQDSSDEQDEDDTGEDVSDDGSQDEPSDETEDQGDEDATDDDVEGSTDDEAEDDADYEDEDSETDTADDSDDEDQQETQNQNGKPARVS